MRFLIYIPTLILLTFLCQAHGNAQESPSLIYGTLMTNSGEEFEGFMRWGKEEMYWHDLFNAEKVQSDQYKSMDDDQSSGGLWSGFDWDLRSLWKNKYSNSSHLFACQFGEIKSLTMRRGDNVDLEMKNGLTIHLNGGSNDVGATIYLHDYELGVLKIGWNKIEKIEFSQAKPSVTVPFSKAIYGQVKTRRNGVITGFVKWDLDERCGDDVLDGDSKYGDQKILFKHISSIIKDGNGSIVKTNGGKEMRLDNSNDVDNGNRGIRVFNQEVGNIEIGWSDFKSLQIIADSPVGPAYTDYKAPKGLKAQVLTFDDQTYEGLIVYDIDEMWEVETLEGNDDNIEYQIPFKNIKRIVPKNNSYSMVYLWCGEEYLLGGSQDVSQRNNGILLFASGKKDAINIKWNDIDEIILKQ